MKPIISKGHLTRRFCFFSVFLKNRSQYWSCDHVRHTKLILRTFLTNPWKQIFDLSPQNFFGHTQSSHVEAFLDVDVKMSETLT